MADLEKAILAKRNGGNGFLSYIESKYGNAEEELGSGKKRKKPVESAQPAKKKRKLN